MHDFTVTHLNDHRLAEFDAEAERSRLVREARTHRRHHRAAQGRVLPARSFARWTWRSLRWALLWARGV